MAVGVEFEGGRAVLEECSKKRERVGDGSEVGGRYSMVPSHGFGARGRGGIVSSLLLNEAVGITGIRYAKEKRLPLLDGLGLLAN